MKAFSRSMSRAKARRGFTLIELIVVLMILVGLAGMVIPAVTDMVQRTHTSAAAGNIHEATNAIARYEGQYLSFPDNLDSLKVAAAGVTTFVAAPGVPGIGGELATGTAVVDLTATEVNALAAAGITSVRLHTIGATDDATFQATGANAAVDATLDLLALTNTAAASLGLVSEANRYVVLGVGNRSQLIGRTMSEAPVHFPENGDENPAAVYNRFLAVFDLGPVATRFERVKLAKVISPHVVSLDQEVGEYFEIINDNQ